MSDDKPDYDEAAVDAYVRKRDNKPKHYTMGALDDTPPPSATESAAPREWLHYLSLRRGQV